MAVAQNLSPYIGTRQSSSSPGTTEYYNAKSGQGFSDPNSLASYVNTLSPNAGATGQNVFSLVEKGFDMPSQSQPTPQPAGVGGPIAPITPQATPVAPATPGAPQPAAQPAQSSQQDFNQLVGTRASAQDPKVTEYFNKSTGQGFATPEDLSAFLNSQGGNTNASNVFSELQKGFQNAMASGKPAPQSPGDAKSAVNALTPPSAVPKQMSPMAPIEQQLSADVGYQQLLADRAEYNSVANQSKSLLDFYNQATKDAGIPGLNEQLLNYKKIIDGTEDDIRREVQAVSGFATESQVLGLASARNKTLIKNYNSLLDAKNMAQETVNNMVNIAGQDRQFALQAIEQKMQINEQIMQYRDKFVQNAKEGYNNVIQAVGYKGLYDMLKDDPGSLALAERTLGLGEGQLQNITGFIQKSSNLKNFANYTITSPYIVTAGGEVQNTQNGEAYTDPLDFEMKTGMTLEQANAKGLIKPLGLTKQETQQNFENKLKLDESALQREKFAFDQQTTKQELGLRGAELNLRKQQVAAEFGDKQVANRDNQVKAIIAANPGQWGNAAKAIDAKFGAGTATLYDDWLKTVYQDGQPASVLRNASEKGIPGQTNPVAQKQGLATSQSNIESINNLLQSKNFFNAVAPTTKTGLNPAGWNLKNLVTGEKNNFISAVETLRGQLTLDNLIKAKGQGATFGALSEGELNLLSSSASKLGTWAVKDSGGNVVGYKASEQDFRRELDKINNFAKMDYILKGGNPTDVGVRQERDGSYTTINSDGSVTQF